jgi:hypothetical protein
LAKKGYNTVLQVKTGHGLFQKRSSLKRLKETLVGVWIVLESIVKDIPLIGIGYCHIMQTTLVFVATKNSGSTKKCDSYKTRYANDWGNTHIHEVDQLDIISKFFESSNMVDKHNQLQQPI